MQHVPGADAEAGHPRGAWSGRGGRWEPLRGQRARGPASVLSVSPGCKGVGRTSWWWARGPAELAHQLLPAFAEAVWLWFGALPNPARATGRSRNPMLRRGGQLWQARAEGSRGSRSVSPAPARPILHRTMVPELCRVRD